MSLHECGRCLKSFECGCSHHEASHVCFECFFHTYDRPEAWPSAIVTDNPSEMA